MTHDQSWASTLLNLGFYLLAFGGLDFLRSRWGKNKTITLSTSFDKLWYLMAGYLAAAMFFKWDW